MKTIEEQAGWCKHYRGRHERGFCEAGVTFASIRDAQGRPASFANLPCFAGEGRLPCAHRVFPSKDDEIAAEVARLDDSMERIGKARAAIVAETKGTRGVAGAIDCPCCGKPKSLRYSVSGYNGHIHAACKGCVSWME